MKRRFPQVSLHIILRELTAKHPLKLYLFWMFNNSVFFERGSQEWLEQRHPTAVRIRCDRRAGILGHSDLAIDVSAGERVMIKNC
jgi:hypothetical protein